MGGVCFAEDDHDAMRYGYGEPGMYGEPGYPYPTGMPERAPRDGGYDTGRDPYHTRPYKHEHGVRDTFGGRGLRPKPRQFGDAPSEDSFPVHGTRHQQDHFSNFEADVQTAFGGRGLRAAPREFGAPQRTDEAGGVNQGATYSHQYVSPQDGYRDAGGFSQPRQESFDGYDDSHDRLQAPRYPLDSESQMPGGPRKKSLSERVAEYKNRKHTEDAHLGLHEYRDVIRPSKSADRPDTGSQSQERARLERKKSLQERVAEFKEKRKHSQNLLSPDATTSAEREGKSRRKSSRGRDSRRRNPDSRERKSSRGRKKSDGKSKKHYSKRDISDQSSDNGIRSSSKGRAKSRAELTTHDIVRKLSQRSQTREDFGGSNQIHEPHRQPPRHSQSNRNQRDQSWVIHE